MSTENTTLEFESFDLNEEIQIESDLFNNLVESETLTEEEATGVRDSFEAAVRSNVKKILEESLVPHYEGQLETLVTEAKEEMAESVNDYLEYVVEEFVKENEEKLVVSETAKYDRNIVEGLLGLFGENYVEVPEGRADLVESLSDELRESREEQDSLEEELINLRNKVKGMECETIFASLCEGLTDSQKEKYLDLVEDLSINDVEEFGRKAKNIRSGLFKASTGSEDEISEELDGLGEGEDESLTEEKTDEEAANPLAEVARLNRLSRERGVNRQSQ